jgi:histidine triad (HIT) family protein
MAPCKNEQAICKIEACIFNPPFLHFIRSHFYIAAMTIFSRIIAGEIPSYKIAENEKFFAFLDVYPLRSGHVLVIPKVEADNLFDLDKDYLSEILVFAQPIAKAIEKAFRCNRCGISVIGLEVPHAHVHLVPINSSNDLNFTQPKPRASEAELKAAQEKILKALEEERN